MSGVTIDHNAWVMVGDGEKALFLGDLPLPRVRAQVGIGEEVGGRRFGHARQDSNRAECPTRQRHERPAARSLARAWAPFRPPAPRRDAGRAHSSIDAQPRARFPRPIQHVSGAPGLPTFDGLVTDLRRPRLT